MLLEKLFSIIPKENIKYANLEYFNSTKITKIISIYRKLKETTKPVILVVSNKNEAEDYFKNLSTLTDNVYVYPEIDILKRATNKSLELEELSIKILNSLLDNKEMILIVTVNSLFRTIKSPNNFINNKNINISLNNYPSFSELPNTLLNMGYKIVDYVENIGEFSKRGSIIDIYSPLNKNPIRLDYFDEELDSIRTFDIIKQTSLEKIENADIYTTTDFFLTKEEKLKIIEKLKLRLDDNNLYNLENFNDIKLHLNSKIELFYETETFDELEAFVNYIYDGEVYSIVDYIKNDTPLFFDNLAKIKIKNKELIEYLRVNLEEISKTNLYQNIIDYKAFEKLQNIKTTKYYLSNIKSNDKEIKSAINLDCIELPFFNNEEQLVKELQDKLKNNYAVVIALASKKQQDYVEKILFDNDLYDSIFVGIHPGKIHIEIVDYNLLGMDNAKNKFLLITENEIFRNAINKKRKKVTFKYSNSEKIRNYQDLIEGDYIVHVHHGIGIYQGIENIEVSGVNKDFLKVVYDGGDIIYVDVENMKYIQKYTATNDTRKPVLNKLGTKKWKQTRTRVQKEIEDISEQLIKLYIARELNSGYAFSKDSLIQKEFEHDFIFTATDDQEKATEEIKRDMEKPRPMDRLLCGDVGFGKTEVAMRVAFKSVFDNKQVAVLVPTTLLAEQHYSNFVERFKNFPVNIEVVSRFKTNKEVNDIIKRLKSGNIDIIIGTHKLLNDKFVYKDLGLLIIDEEQRFGVKHKEKIKHLKNMIDVLTLTATPIPRTLHMSLIGIRDLSVIETPPNNRQPIQTYIMSENIHVIKEAVLNEIERGGQVFYLYNKVETIEEKYLELKKLLPDLNIAFAHGRMSKDELEDIMIDVINKEYDVLVTTTIIETGIDIANVNTLIIEDADKFGLSQLYQIRGRVGRSSREAYAYLMYKPFKALTETAEKRLSAIKNFTSLGSGFKIAMQDLTIRGAGDVLGGKQHGFIDSVGYTLYSQMLEKELLDKKEILTPILEQDKTKDVEYYENIVKQYSVSKKDIFEIEEEQIEIKINSDAYIPREYMSNDADKIYFYKLFNNAKTEEDVNEIIEELIDRFSDFGVEVENLISICLIKIFASNIMINNIKELANKIEIVFKKEIMNHLDGKKLFELLVGYNDVRIFVKDTLTMEIDKKDMYSLDRVLKIIKTITPAFAKEM